ncbi:MAG: HipA domain-containing protein [Polyangiaceae bacterium]
MTVVDVRIGAVRTGILERFEDEEHRFSFDGDWLSNPTHPILGQLFEDRLPRDIHTSGLPCWFAHLLPQGPLLRMIAREAGVDPLDYLDILQFLGADLPGAVVLSPGQAPSYRRPPAQTEPATGTGGRLRFSALAGAQSKLSVHPGERGLVLPVEGGMGSWIAKFHSPSFTDLPRVEHATMTWARESGIRVPPFRLGSADEIVDIPEGIPTGSGEVYLIERFDRQPGNIRVHMEDFGQVLDRPPGDGPGGQFSGRYEHIAAVLSAIAPHDIRELCERIVFCVLAGNGDAHLKNWTVLYPDGRTPRLSPAYDLVSTVVYPHVVEDCLALDLGTSRRFEDVSEMSFELLARSCGISFEEMTTWVRAQAERVRAVWAERATDFSYSDAERGHIEAHLARVPLGRQ